MKLKFIEDTHKYYYKDEEVPSVTEILQVIGKPNLIYWGVNSAVDFISDAVNEGMGFSDILRHAKLLPDKLKNEAGTRGRAVHKWIEQYQKDPTITIPEDDELKGYIEAYFYWLLEVGIKPLKSEIQVFNKPKGYCGTLDMIGEKDGELYLIDLKTSKKIYPEHLMQTAAYQAAYEKNFKEKISKRMVVRLGKNGQYSFVVTDDFKGDYKAFLSVLELYNFLKEFNEKKT